MVDNPRKYGHPPYECAVVHGGPGACGEMAAVARELSRDGGILEPLVTGDTLGSQVLDLSEVLRAHAEVPVTLIGHSWGAWLAMLTAALHPGQIGKVILIGAGPFEPQYAQSILPTRLSRLSEDSRQRYGTLMRLLDNPEVNDAEILQELGRLVAQTDVFDALPPEFPAAQDLQFGLQPGVFGKLMSEASHLRANGELLGLAGQVRCPVVAIHGDYDPHPAEGVREPLSSRLGDFRFILLEKCGHAPWLERHAREPFLDILRAELKRSNPRGQSEPA